MKMQKAFKQKIALLLAVILLCTLGITPSFGFISKADNTDATPTDATEGPYMIGSDGTIYEEELYDEWKWIIDTPNDEIVANYDVTKQEMVDMLLGYTRNEDGVATKDSTLPVMQEVDVPMVMATNKAVQITNPTSYTWTVTKGLNWKQTAQGNYINNYRALVITSRKSINIIRWLNALMRVSMITRNISLFRRRFVTEF